MRSILSAVLLMVLCASAAQAAEVQGVKIADRVRVTDSGPELVLNGAGVRTRFIFSVYVGALYLQQKTNAPKAIFADLGPKRIAMHLLRDLTAEQLFTAMSDGLKANHTPVGVAAFAPQIKALEAIFNAVKSARTGDVILLDYVPGTGTVVTVNGEVRGQVAGAEFNRALLRIWLGEQPADSDLKRAMLGNN